MAVVVALALSVVVTKALGRYTDALPPSNIWTLVVTLVLEILVAVFVPWLLLAGRCRCADYPRRNPLCSGADHNAAGS